MLAEPNFRTTFSSFPKAGALNEVVHQVTPLMSPSGPGTSIIYCSAVPGTLTFSASDEVSTSQPFVGAVLGSARASS